jgi:DNA-binding NtrC family response regulator
MKTPPNSELPPPYADDVFIGTSPAVQRLRLQVERIAPHFRIALITGEPGAGKYSVALQMHRSSPAASRAFTVIPAHELAQNSQPLSDDGTVYIPGLESLHPASQGRLLRAIKALSRETRVIVASHYDLKGLVSAGRMRHDLYDAVGTLEIRVAPVRDRIQDIQPIVLGMLQRLSTDATFTPDALIRIHQHSWPGNLEELWATCQNLDHTGSFITRHDLSRFDVPAEVPTPTRLEEVMHRHVMDVLQSCSGNKLRAAEALGISRSTLYRMLESQPQALS